MKLSGKKKKLLLKEAKRLMNEKKQMDGEWIKRKIYLLNIDFLMNLY